MYLHDELEELERNVRALVPRLNALADAVEDVKNAVDRIGSTAESLADGLRDHVEEIEARLARVDRARVIGPLLDGLMR